MFYTRGSQAELTGSKLVELAGTFSLAIILTLSIGYVFLNARNDWYADIMLLLLLCISLPRFLRKVSGDPFFCKYITAAFTGYLALAVIGVFFPQSPYVDSKWLIESFFRLIIVFIIVQSIHPLSFFDRRMLRPLVPFLCILLALFVILTTKGLLLKGELSFLTPWGIVQGAGNNKYISFILLFLMWASVALLWRKGVKQSIFASGIIVLVISALFSSTSESSQLASLVGLSLFVFTHIPLGRRRYKIYFFVFSLFLVAPLLWVLFTPVMSRNPWEVFRDKSSFLHHYWSIGSRLYLYDFCAGLVREKFLLGYGFGSTLSIPIPTNVLPGRLMMPGGHPHNIVFLILIEHGIIGYLWLVGTIMVLFDYLYKLASDNVAGPAIWALVISGQIVFSLSFSIWHPDVVLTYGIFFILLLIIVNFFSLEK